MCGNSVNASRKLKQRNIFLWTNVWIIFEIANITVKIVAKLVLAILYLPFELLRTKMITQTVINNKFIIPSQLLSKQGA